MRIRRCEHCNEIFQYKPSGAASILCGHCVALSSDNYMPVYRHIKKFGFSSVKEISEVTEVHPALVKGLVMDGRFQTGDSDSNFEDAFEAQRRLQLLEMMGKGQSAIHAANSKTSSSDPVKTTSSRRNYGLGAK